MRATIARCLALLMFAVTATAVVQSQAGPDDRFRVSLTINGTKAQGSQELVAASAGKTAAERRALQDAAVLSVQPNVSFQLVVTVTGPDGTTTDFTRSSRVLYEHFGCLTISTAGFVTVTPSGPCKGPNVPTLWIAFTDETGQPITYNEYQFRVVQ
jgi:hypothetical protein